MKFELKRSEVDEHYLILFADDAVLFRLCQAFEAGEDTTVVWHHGKELTLKELLDAHVELMKEMARLEPHSRGGYLEVINVKLFFGEPVSGGAIASSHGGDMEVCLNGPLHETSSELYDGFLKARENDWSFVSISSFQEHAGIWGGRFPCDDIGFAISSCGSKREQGRSSLRRVPIEGKPSLIVPMRGLNNLLQTTSVLGYVEEKNECVPVSISKKNLRAVLATVCEHWV